MPSFLQNLLMPADSSFVIIDIDHLRKVVILEDAHLGLTVNIPIGEKPLKEAKILGPYSVLFTYADGTKEKKRILE